jgi:cytochrome c peroxidase
MISRTCPNFHTDRVFREYLSSFLHRKFIKARNDKDHLRKIGINTETGLNVNTRIFLTIVKSLLFFTVALLSALRRWLHFLSHLPFKLTLPWQRSIKMRRLGLPKLVTISVLVASMVIAAQLVSAQIAPPSAPLASLRTVPVPKPSNLNQFVQNETAAIALGKALFWDMQVGSDGINSCASCHFHAGADNRDKNQVSPGLLRVKADGTPDPDQRFHVGGAPNYTLRPDDFPFHKLSDPSDRDSTVISSKNDVSSSQGVFFSTFNGINVGSPQDNVTFQPDPVFNINGTEVRRVEPRNSPTVINAVFNFRNFWDGRAQNEFNGVNPFGSRDPDAFLLRRVGNDLVKTKVSLNNSSLASQAVGPPLSAFEMSADGRTLPDVGSKLNKKRARIKRAQLGRKLRALRPLGQQIVHPQDSVLGSLSRFPQRGLNTNYDAMIKAAFRPEWWNSNLAISIDANGEPIFTKKPAVQLTDAEFTQMEYNFSLFFGLAIQAYESTLISDRTPFDQFMEGKKGALSAQQKRGLEIFQDKGKCINCHGGPEFTNASVQNVKKQPLERMAMAQGVAVYDNGFYNIGVRPTREDLGVGGKDPFGKPLSMTRLAQEQGPPFPNVPGEDPAPSGRLRPNERVAVDGAFKTPGLRNIELTAPYFHNGGQLTLKQVVEFYNRGGDFHDKNIADLDPDIENLNLTEQEQNDLVAFMESLTDDRVRYDKAPFDHPQLFITDGHKGNKNAVTDDGTGKAEDRYIEIPAVGRNGGVGTPNFLQAALANQVIAPQPAAATSTSTTSPASTSTTPSAPTSTTPSAPAPGAGYSQADCPAGTTFVPVANGFLCE